LAGVIFGIHTLIEPLEKGYLHEVFSSIQGEGVFAGQVQHFLRLAGCSVGCRYCDTPAAHGRAERYMVDGALAGENPMDVSGVIALLNELDRSHPRTQGLAITGGEPLEQAGFLARLIPEVRSALLKGRPVLLETAGIHVEAMAALADRVDMVSMDIKLPTTSGLGSTFSDHERFLKALQGIPCYVKVVVNPDTPLCEVEEAASMVAGRKADIPFFLQPESVEGRIMGGGYLIAFWETARAYLRDVRVQPQIHRTLELK
jgi:organic radical activating enzyme